MKVSGIDKYYVERDLLETMKTMKTTSLYVFTTIAR